MARDLNQKIMTEIYEGYEKFRKDLYEFKNTNNPEIQRKMEQFTEILDVIKTQEIMRMTEREEIKNTILLDLKQNPLLLSDIDAIKNLLRYIDTTEKIDLFRCKELTKYLEMLQFLMTQQMEPETEYEDILENIPESADIPKMLAHLLFKYDRAEDEERQDILELIRQLPNQAKIKTIMENEGIEYDTAN